MAGRYNQIKTTIDEIEFDSKSEGMRYAQLKLREKEGLISGLRMQIKYDLNVNGQKICKYIADFVYENEDGITIVEDVKNAHLAKSRAFRLKAKLFKAIYGHNIKVVDSKQVLWS